MKNKLLASILTACMLLTMLPTAAFAAETEAEPSAEQTATAVEPSAPAAAETEEPGTEQTASGAEQSDPVTEDAGKQPEGTADGTDAGDAALGQTAENSVAEVVGGQSYATLAEAVDAATDGETVKLLKDAEGDGIGLYANPKEGQTGIKNITIDFDNHTYTANGKLHGSTGTVSQVVHLEKGSNVTLKNGTLTRADAASMMIQNYADLTLDNMVIDGTKIKNGGTVVSVNCGTVNVTGKTSITGNAGVTAFDVSWWTSAYPDGAQVVLNTEGTITGNLALGIYGSRDAGLTADQKNPANVKSKIEIQNVKLASEIVPGYYPSGSFACGCTEEEIAFILKVMCSISGGTFSDVSCLEYLAAGAEVDVVLDKDVTANVTIPANTTVTLDLNGKTLTSAANNQSTIVVNGNLTVEDSTAGQPTVSNKYEVSYTSGSIKSTDIPVKVQNGGSFTLNSGKIESETESGLFVIGDKTGTDAINSSATINGGYINSQEYGIGVVGKGASLTVNDGAIETRDNAVIGGNGTYNESDKQGDTTITITGGTMIGHITTGGYVACGVYHPQSGTLNISGGTIYADSGVGVLMRGGTANITGGEIITTGKQEVVGKVGDSKVVVGCHGVQVDGISRYYDYDNAKVEISGNVKIQSESEAVKHTDNPTPTAQKIFISNGTFSSDVNDYCATGYTATKNESGQWVVDAKVGMEADTSVSGNTASAEVGGSFSGSEDLETDNVGASNGTLSIDATVTEGGTAVTKTEVSIGSKALTSVSSANSVNSVVLKTNVADLTVDKAAWNAITENAGGGSVTLTVEKKEDASSPADWTVSAVNSKGETVFSSEDQHDGKITISVPYTKEKLNDGDRVVVYYIGENGQLEAMTTTYNQENKTLTWTTDHLSDFGDVVIGPDTEAVWISGTELKAGTLAEALSAVASNGGTIDLVNNATLTSARFVISKDVIIQKSTIAAGIPTINATVADGAATGAFMITENASLTLNGVKLVVEGTGDTENKGGQYDGTGIILNNIASGAGGKLVLNNAEVELTGLQRGMVFQVNADKLASVEMDNSKLTIQNIDGNATNGGSWNVKNNSTVTVSNCGDHGLSAQEIAVDHSAVRVDNVGYVGVLAQKVELKNGADVSVTDSGKKLPFESTWAPNGTQYENAVEIKKNGSLSVDETSSMELTGNKYDSILVADQGSLDNKGTITGEIVTTGSQHIVKVLVDGKIVAAATVEDEGSYTLPDAPSKTGYDFKGWSNGTTTYGAKDEVKKITGNMTFTAVWEKKPDRPSGGGSSSDNERTYAIVTEDDGHGSVTVSADEASAGTRITVTVKPNSGYALDELTVTDAKNKELSVTKRSETTYTFHMADSKVTVEASFTKDSTVQKPDTRFDDVAKSAWYCKAVDYVAENGIMSGVSAREFAPNAGFSRAMLAQTLYAMSGKPAVKAESAFADVAASAWYADAVNWAAKKGYVSGVGEGMFAPDASITREQMALILYRYAGSPDASGMALKEFADGGSVSAYAVDAVRWAVHEGLISGMENNTLAPQGTATRAQVAQILMNFHQKLDK